MAEPIGSGRFCSLRRCKKLCAKYSVPKAAGDTETILIIRKMVLKVVLLEFAVIRGEAETNVSSVDVQIWVRNIRSVVEEVVREIVTYVSEYSAAVDCRRCVPVVEKHCVRQFPERGCKYDE